MILNPASGGADRATVEAALNASGLPYEIRETSEGRDAGTLAREAREAGCADLLVAGGDGTVMAAVNGLGPNSGVTLGIVPTGTANLVAAGLGLPKDPAEAVRVALSGEPRAMDLGVCEGRLFALGMGLGLTERFVTEASPGLKHTLGRWAYVWSLIKELGARPHRFSLTLDDGTPIEDRGVALVIANMGSLGGGLRFAPDARPDDGILDVCVLRRFRLRDAAHLLLSLLKKDLKHDRALAFHRAKRIEFSAAPPLTAQLDGDAIDAKTPIVVEVVPGALAVRVPS